MYVGMFFFKQKTAYELRISDWSSDVCSSDLIRSRVLPRRGIKAQPHEILVTLGAQNALYLIAALLGGPGKVLAVDNPGYVDVRNIFGLHGTEMRPIPTDSVGMVVDECLASGARAHVTPSTPPPHTVTDPPAPPISPV